MALDTLLLTLGPSDERRVDALVAAVVDIVGDRDTEVVLLHVFDRETYEGLQSELHIDPDSETTPDDVAERKDLIRRVAEALTDRGVDCSVRGALDETPEDAILRVADETAADHLVVGGGDRSPAGKAVFGSTAQNVLLNAPVPVTFVRGE